MIDARASWLDPKVGALTWHALLEQLGRGPSRIVLWGPRGSGRSTLLARLARERPEVLVVDAPSAAAARAALDDAPRDVSLVVVSRARSGLDADAYVECRSLPIDDASDDSALAFLQRLLARDGAPAPIDAHGAALQAIARHTEGLPGLVRRAADLLRLMTPAELAARCEQATTALTLHGALLEHPLARVDEGAEALDAARCSAAVVLVAAGEPIPLGHAIAWLSAGGLDALLALRDDGELLLGDDGRVAARASLARVTARRQGFAVEFAHAASLIDADAIMHARAARERWLGYGDESALGEIGAYEGRLRRAAERALLRLDAPGAIDALVESVLALYARSEIHVGPRADGELLRRACAAVGDAPAGRALALERAHFLRVAGRFDELERALAAIEPATLPEALAGRWHVERAHVFRYRRDLDAAVTQLAHAAQHSAAQTSRPHDHVRDALEFGALRYWQQRFDDALALFAQARTLAARLGATRSEAVALSNLCLCHTMTGDESAAGQHGSAAVALLRRIGDSGALGTTLGHLGILAYQYGHLDDAERFLAEAETRVEHAGYFEQRVFVRFNRACVALAAGDLSAAHARLQSLPAMLAADPSPHVSIHLCRLEADLHEHHGRFAEARAALEIGVALSKTSSYAEGSAQLGAQRARILARMGAAEHSRAAAADAREALSAVSRADLHAPVELVLEHAALLRGEREASARKLADALRPIWEGASVRARIGVSAFDSGAVRAAALMYWRDLDASARVEVEWAARDPSTTALCLDARSERCRLPGGELLESATRRNAHRLLCLLAASAEGSSRDSLIERMWPGEQILEEAALNRLHNALAQLRAAGLASHLLREQERYRLDGLRVIHAGRVDPFASPLTDR